MAFIAVTELKKSKDLWRRLDADRELVVTRDGKPVAIIVGIQPDELESSLREIRRALFSAAVGRVRERARSLPDADAAIDEAVRSSRAGRA